MSSNDGNDGDTSARTRRAMEFLRQARKLRGLSPAATERIERSIETAGNKRRPRGLRMAAAVAAVALVAGGTFAMAHVGWRNLPFVGPLFAPAAPKVPRSEPSVHSSAATAKKDLAAIVPAEVAPMPKEAAAPSESKRPVAVRKVVSERTTLERNAPVLPAPAEVAVDPILAESQSFAEAIERWHRDHDGRGALAALDTHEQRFPSGRLGVEARVLRAEILLSRGSEREGLMILDRMNLAGAPRARELLTVRGELRIKLGRCAEGRADLEEVLRKGTADGFAKRAAQALEHCP
jgi:uncharacterized protein YjiS (DUF1127 family)